MNLNELDQYLELINSVLLKSAVKINKWREKFMLEVLLLHLIIPGRINFLQLGRYGRFGEQRYRQQFGRRFDWLSFNANLESFSSRMTIGTAKKVSPMNTELISYICSWNSPDNTSTDRQNPATHPTPNLKRKKNACFLLALSFPIKSFNELMNSS